MSGPLQIEISDLAKGQIRAAEQWWRVNRPHAPNASREELERASLLIALHPLASDIFIVIPALRVRLTGDAFGALRKIFRAAPGSRSFASALS